MIFDTVNDIIHYSIKLTATEQRMLCGVYNSIFGPTNLLSGTKDKNSVTCLDCLRVGFNPDAPVAVHFYNNVTRDDLKQMREWVVQTIHEELKIVFLEALK